MADPAPGPRMTELPEIPSSFSQAIATRDLDVVRDGRTSGLRIEIGQPVQDVATVTGMDWRCPLRLQEDGGEVRLRSACGIDAYQALRLAFDLVAQELGEITATGARLRFLDCPYDVASGLPDPGMPPPG